MNPRMYESLIELSRRWFCLEGVTREDKIGIAGRGR